MIDQREYNLVSAHVLLREIWARLRFTWGLTKPQNKCIVGLEQYFHSVCRMFTSVVSRRTSVDGNNRIEQTRKNKDAREALRPWITISCKYNMKLSQFFFEPKNSVTLDFYVPFELKVSLVSSIILEVVLLFGPVGYVNLTSTSI